MFLKSDLVLNRNKRTLAETVLEMKFKSTMHYLHSGSAQRRLVFPLSPHLGV